MYNVEFSTYVTKELVFNQYLSSVAEQKVIWNHNHRNVGGIGI